MSRLVVGLWLVALAGNVSYSLLLEDRLVLTSDPDGYDRGGLNLAQGKGFPTKNGWQPKREPGMAVFLGAVYYVFGHGHRAVRLVQAVLSSTFCVLVYVIARRYCALGHLSPATPAVAAALTVVYPAFVFYTGMLLRQILTTFLFLLSLVFLTEYVLTGRLKQAALYGVLTGLGALVEGRFLFFPVFFGVVCLVRSRDWRRTGAFLAASFGVALLVVSPWTIRNYIVFDRFVLLSTAQYKGLWLVTNPEEFLDWDWEREPLKSLSALPAEEREKTLARLAAENLRKYPWAYAKSSVRRFFRLWIGGHSHVMPLMERSVAAAVAARDWGYVAIKSLFVGVNLAYVLGGAAGAALYVRRFGAGSVLHLVGFLVYISLMHMMLYASPRYHIPAIPVLTIFLAYLMTSIATRAPVERQALWAEPARKGK